MEVAASTLIIATGPSRAKAPSSVTRRQPPHGTEPRARSPRGARACVRVILVVTPLSSTKIRSAGSALAVSSR